MALNIYAGATVASMIELPSPTEITPSYEPIWTENTGRAQEGTNIAKMLGRIVAEKVTYDIKWGVLQNPTTHAPVAVSTIINAMKGPGSDNDDVGSFFYFAVAQTLADAKTNAKKFYRGNVNYTILPIGNTVYYKDVSVEVIQQ